MLLLGCCDNDGMRLAEGTKLNVDDIVTNDTFDDEITTSLHSLRGSTNSITYQRNSQRQSLQQTKNRQRVVLLGEHEDVFSILS